MQHSLQNLHMPAQFKINEYDLEEYLSVLDRYSEVPSDDDEKLRELIRSYAELKFRIVGGSRCALCKAHVRHVVPIITANSQREEHHYACLCTRCFEGEKGTAERMFLEMGESRIEVKLNVKADPTPRRPKLVTMPPRSNHA
jgi:hypothetical protein